VTPQVPEGLTDRLDEWGEPGSFPIHEDDLKAAAATLRYWQTVEPFLAPDLRAAELCAEVAGILSDLGEARPVRISKRTALVGDDTTSFRVWRESDGCRVLFDYGVGKLRGWSDPHPSPRDAVVWALAALGVEHQP
jgi:hypothetical protein